MTGGINPGRVAGDLGLTIPTPVSWDAVLDAAVQTYWQRRREQRAKIPARLEDDHASLAARVH